ncbi:MAG: 50S ribosomal protein L3 [Desulfobacterales bacterium]
MCKGLLGKKLGMTAYFTPAGDFVPVTVMEVGPCVVTQIKTTASDGYNALQLGMGTKKAKRVNKPMQGHLQKSGAGRFAWLREVPVDNPQDYQLGQSLNLDLFQIGEKVDVVGTTKGRGFSGTIRRHGFHRGPAGHGSKNVRPPGSIGTSAWPSRVTKGKKMPGQYGSKRKTVCNLTVVDIRADQNLMFLKGAVPGYAPNMVLVKKVKYAGRNT